MKGFAIRDSGLGSNSECTEDWLDCFSNATAGPKHGHDTHALHGLGLSYPTNNPVRHTDRLSVPAPRDRLILSFIAPDIVPRRLAILPH